MNSMKLRDNAPPQPWNCVCGQNPQMSSSKSLLSAFCADVESRVALAMKDMIVRGFKPRVQEINVHRIIAFDRALVLQPPLEEDFSD